MMLIVFIALQNRYQFVISEIFLYDFFLLFALLQDNTMISQRNIAQFWVMLINNRKEN